MALINCPECQAKVSDQAVSCPSCGFSIGSMLICPECHAKIAKDIPFCPSCGFPFPKEEKPSQQSATGESLKPQEGMFKTVIPVSNAPLERRLFAFLIDGFFINLMTAVIALFLVLSKAIDPSEPDLKLLCGGISLLLSLIYFSVCLAAYGYTPGKYFMGLILIDGHGEIPNFGKTFVRTLVMFILAPLCITWWPVFGKNRRAIHDYAAGTYVVTSGQLQARPKEVPVQQTIKAETSQELPMIVCNERDNSELILIPSGEFLMGSPQDEGRDDEHPQHRVYLDAYYIGKYEVTNKQFAKFVNETGYNAGGDWKKYYNSGTEDHPVVCVRWYDAKAYCNWAKLRLPTEAEWEKAARSTDGREYPWGNEWDSSRCNFNSSGTNPVGSYSSGASPYGCLDMVGNVCEWCSDWYDRLYYSSSPQSNPQGTEIGNLRVLRGGSWGINNEDALRAAARLRDYPGLRSSNDGFRVARGAR